MDQESQFHHYDKPMTTSQVLCDGWLYGVMLAALPLSFALVLFIEPASGPIELTPLSLLSFLIIFPVIEELAFRGLIQGLLLSRTVGRWRIGTVSVANLITTVLFACAHFPRGGWLLACGVVAPSLLLGLFRERHGRLLSPILLHIFFNLAMLAALAWHYGSA
ncbi:JDVT-CTERM system glutamic-type intramembrane protease MrtJ [Halorhodospira halochloris]|uniref:JDVT-CTERM system glutamic-type intramembrane protease MrtJ n=1 Tax=Halorhodospira halochloris TaxID=1052 RepID=UPI001EE7E212|nr:JDVT-CTERM system glutamic-type intramembrane protease [Halorhodospira halochloris]MCG5547571.1 JDVT-CTERM system glutamic-type intramembrane protease [Halorhodospira halochloris]